MTWRENWLLALPPFARLMPPFVLALCGTAGLVWLDHGAPSGLSANLTPLVWFGIGAGLLVRPAQPLVVASTAFGMAGLAGLGALRILLGLDWDLWQPAHALRVVLWGALSLFALPAAIFEAMAVQPALGRRLYFGAVTLFFAEQGIRRLLGLTGRPSEGVFFLLVALVALSAVFVAGRTAPASAPVSPPEVEEETKGVARRRIRYLDEPPPV